MRFGLVLPALAVAGGLVACGPITPATLKYISTDPSNPKLGQSTTITFAALDERGNPEPGVEVTFEVQSADQSAQPGITLSPTSAITDKNTGQVHVQVSSASRVAGAVVVAKAGDPKTGQRVAVSAALSFAGAAPNTRQFTFQCGEIAGTASGGIHAIQVWDDTRNMIAGVRLNCSAHVGDRNGDGVDGAVVSFLTEAGTIGPSETSVTDVVGNATVLYKSSLPLPVPTDPITVNVNAPDPTDDKTLPGLQVPMWLHPWEWRAKPVVEYGLPGQTGIEPSRTDPVTGVTLFNPRDNLVTLIAVTAGEEGFTDLNDNGQWDPGEPYDDTTEPFVDANDNGTYDVGERYVDTDGNGHWDGRNGKYDASTLIWASEKILWTGIPEEMDIKDTTNGIFKVLNGTVTVPYLGEAGPVNILISDPWFNEMAADAFGDGCSLPETGGNVIKMDPPTFLLGIPTSYETPKLLSFFIVDARDPTQNPPPPFYSQPIDFNASISCTFTGSPVNGFKLVYPLPRGVSGTIPK